MIKKLIICGTIALCLLAACAQSRDSQPSYQILTAEQPPFGISVFKDSSGEYLVVRSKQGYGEGLAIIKR